MAESLNVALRHAGELTSRGESRRAVTLLTPLVAQHPTHAGLWCRLAAAHLSANDPERALAAAHNAINADNNQTWGYRLAALAFHELGRDQEAIAAARAGVRRARSDWRCHTVLAQVLSANPAQRRAAIKAAVKATKLAPNEPAAFQTLADVAIKARDSVENSVVDHRRSGKMTGYSTRATTAHRRKSQYPVNNRPVRDLTQSLLPLMWLLGTGCLTLMLAGLPRPTMLLGWISIGLAGITTGAFGWITLRIIRLRHSPAQLPKNQSVLFGVVGLFGLADLLLILWSLAVVFGGKSMLLLVVAWILALAGIGGTFILRGIHTRSGATDKAV